MIEAFLAQSTGGHRLRAITVALFEAIGSQFGSFAEVRRTKPTSRNAPNGAAAQIECMTDDGTVVLAIEVQHRVLTFEQLRSKVCYLRENGVREAFFITCSGVRDDDLEDIHAMVDREFVSGQNLYITEFLPLCRTILGLLGESGRRRFLEYVCRQLDAHTSVIHRRTWADLLKSQ